MAIHLATKSANTVSGNLQCICVFMYNVLYTWLPHFSARYFIHIIIVTIFSDSNSFCAVVCTL